MDIGVLLQAVLVVFSLMTVLWLVSLAIKNASIVDIFWGVGFVLVAWVTFLQHPGNPAPRSFLLLGLVTVWGLRLSLYILSRNLPKGEDFRYVKWRQEHGKAWWWRSYFQVFVLQGILMLIISVPLVVVISSTSQFSLGWLDALAVLLWLVGFVFEAGGDWQLARFKANPANKGKLLTTGLWQYTRHPNYFGDAAQWWAFYLFAILVGGWWTVFSPLIMSLLLRNVSGVALLEKTLVDSKPGYRQYVESTNAFIPWFPRQTK